MSRCCPRTAPRRGLYYRNRTGEPTPRRRGHDISAMVSGPVMKVATLAVIVVVTPTVVHAHRHEGDWQCWHNYQLSKPKDDLDHAMADLDRSNNDVMEQISRDAV